MKNTPGYEAAKELGHWLVVKVWMCLFCGVMYSGESVCWWFFSEYSANQANLPNTLASEPKVAGSIPTMVKQNFRLPCIDILREVSPTYKVRIVNKIATARL